MNAFETALAAAKELTDAERLRLIDELWATVPPEMALAEEWHDEIERRSAEIDAGTAKLESWQTVRERLRASVNDSH